MNRCQTCSFFHARTGQCTHPQLRTVQSAAEIGPGDLGVLAESHRSDAVILVHPDFGCVHHQSAR